jgi:hypothetical protein
MRGSKNRRILAIVVGVLAVAIVAFVAIGLILPSSWPGRVLQGAGVGGAQPEYGVATVDGKANEWAGSPVFTGMYRAWKTTKPLETNLYLRYDCGPGIMYSLVMTAGDWPLLISSGDPWIAIDSNSKKVTFTNFAWVGRGYDGNSDHAQGWEASFAIAQGNYSLWAHTNVDHGGSQTSGIEGVGLTIQCYHTTAVFLNYFNAKVQPGGGVLLRWETASETDNLGFNLYRGTSDRGQWTKLNDQLIPSSAAPESPLGASYQWLDPSGTKKFRYVLEAVDIKGSVTRQGPITPKR